MNLGRWHADAPNGLFYRHLPRFADNAGGRSIILIISSTRSAPLSLVANSRFPETHSTLLALSSSEPRSLSPLPDVPLHAPYLKAVRRQTPEWSAAAKTPP